MGAGLNVFTGKLPLPVLSSTRVGFGADAIAKWVQERTEIHVRVFRPPNYTGTVALVMLFALVSTEQSISPKIFRIGILGPIYDAVHLIHTL